MDLCVRALKGKAVAFDAAGDLVFNQTLYGTETSALFVISPVESNEGTGGSAAL